MATKTPSKPAPKPRGLPRRFGARQARSAVPRRVLASLALCTALACTQHASAQRATHETKGAAADHVDRIALAARLIADRHFDRAEHVLREIDQRAQTTDLKRVHAYLGMVQLHRQDFLGARASLIKAIRKGASEPIVHLYLAQAHFGLNDHRRGLRELDRAGSEADRAPVYRKRAEAHWALDEPARALAILAQGSTRFPERKEFMQLEIAYLIELGLFQAAVGSGKRFLVRKDVAASDYLAIGEALRRAKRFESARQLLEAARLRFWGHSKLSVLLAHCYLDDGRPLPAAMIFENLARFDGQYTHQAAELYRRAGRLERALALNARIADQKIKIKQRLSILLQMERFEMVAAMAPRLSRLDLITDDGIRYALAYGYYRIGELQQAEHQLRHIEEPDVFRRATQLRRAMQACRRAQWECS
ncbi:MAG: hypothetical protein MJD61_09555 [Proteobacteria bacterium]|nr:hypothetical protein [Pseudomonadota bacterium]